MNNLRALLMAVSEAEKSILDVWLDFETSDSPFLKLS